MNPSPDQYRLLFDVTHDGSRAWAFPAFGLVFVAIGVGVVVYERRTRAEPSKRSRALGAWALLVFATLWTSLSGVASYREYRTLLDAVENGTVKHVEGTVDDFVPMPANGHGVEHFAVNGKRFEYSDNVLTFGFNRTSAKGGPMRAGLQVRIGYVDGTIVRLESR
jgi:hypothetical protein